MGGGGDGGDGCCGSGGVCVCVCVCVSEMRACARVSEGRLQMSVFTDADGPGLVPAGLAVPPHDAGEGGVPLQGVASVTLVGDRGAQLEVGSHARPVPHRARLEARLPWVLCEEGERREREQKGGRDTEQKATVVMNLLKCFLCFFSVHSYRACAR